jgi:hypothetical protein
VDKSYLAKPWEVTITECLTDFRFAFLGKKFQDYYLQHGRFKGQYESWLQLIAAARTRATATTAEEQGGKKHFPVHKNRRLRSMFDLDYRCPSEYLPYSCLFRKFGSSSFFIIFDDGRFFLLGNLDNSPGKSLQYYQDFLLAINTQFNMMMPASSPADMTTTATTTYASTSTTVAAHATEPYYCSSSYPRANELIEMMDTS